MAQAASAEPAASKPEQSDEAQIEVKTEAKEEDTRDEKAHAEGEAGEEQDDAEAGEGQDGAEVEEEQDGAERPVSNEQYKALKNITDVLTNHKIKLKGDEDHFPSMLFRRIPNRRNLPDYHEIIKDPVALSTLKGKIQRKQYTGIPEFVRDFALIVHNAQIYNRPNSAPVRDVFELQKVFKEELQKLVDEGLVKQEETVFPDLGEIPAATPEPDPVSEEEDNDDAQEDDEEDEEEGDDSDDDRRRRKSRKGGRASISGRKGGEETDEKLNEGDLHKRRGRPPKVDTPMEARIKAILKGIRKPKDKAGNMKIRHFERLPDKTEYPEYFLAIKDPIAVDTIKKKAKRKKYQSLEQFMKDLDLMFNNAKQFNEDGSEIYQDAVELQAEAHKLLEIEKAKPDEEYLMEDGRRPLPSGILHKNELWKVGDWVHIQNPNDVTKPIVAQIYRTWEDPEGQKWINACWYYRPEQTVHQYEKHFFPNEVVKTGQYRDHRIEEVVDRCFVMFFTRYSRGRPRNIDPTKEVYVCEARYNEEKHKFNKIKTWASCLPDEVRDKDYEMDLFDTPRKIKKVPSPLKHLLKDDMKETDETPSPTWGHPNAPPIIGAIHKQPRDENQSPPPEPTPPPPPTPPPQPVRPPSASTMQNIQSRPSMDRQTSTGSAGNLQPQLTRPSPSVATPHMAASYPKQSISPAPQYGHRQTLYQQPQHQHQHPQLQPNIAPQTPSTPQQQPLPSYVPQQQLHPPPPNLATAAAAHHTAPYGPGHASTPVAPNYVRPTQVQQQPAMYAHAPNAVGVGEQRASEVYVLSELANASIPKRIRDRFPQDDQGRILFFTKPPVIHDWTVRGRDGEPLVHTEKYLAAKVERDKIIATRKRARQDDKVKVAAASSFKRVKETRGPAVA